MANTYTQIHIHSVFAVQGRNCLIGSEWEEELYRYIAGIIRNQGHKLLAINGMPDHLHVFYGMKPDQSVSSLMQDIKGDSSKWINQKGFIHGRFSWQQGYGAFSYSKSDVNRVIDYIKGQKLHHRKQSFIEEYRGFLRKFNIEFDDKYIFKSIPSYDGL